MQEFAADDQQASFRRFDPTVGLTRMAAALAALGPGLWIAGWPLRSAWYWRKIVAYARTGK
jgi:hypothetical protein